MDTLSSATTLVGAGTVVVALAAGCLIKQRRSLNKSDQPQTNTRSPINRPGSFLSVKSRKSPNSLQELKTQSNGKGDMDPRTVSPKVRSKKGRRKQDSGDEEQQDEEEEYLIEYYEFQNNGSPCLMYYEGNCGISGWMKPEGTRVTSKVGRPTDFKHLITKGYIYIDRSLFIKDFIDFNGRVALILRPEGFGKTINLSMLYYFFNTERRGEQIPREAIFQDLEIWEYTKIVKDYFKKHPCIFFNIKNVKGVTWAEMYNDIKLMISWLYSDHSYLKDSLDPKKKDLFHKVQNRDPSLSDKTWETSIRDLTTYLYQYHSQHSIVLVDDFDRAVLLAHEMGFHQKALAFFKSLFTELLKDNPYLYRAIIMGVETNRRANYLPAHTWEYSLSNKEPYFQDKFGFTETDVHKITTLLEMPDGTDEMIMSKSAGGKISSGKKKIHLYTPTKVWNEIQETLGPRHPSMY